ncbi:MAG: undecaprenyl/decaprenyl-phosphate alpha-N-acetylglucosaminyl 1-phosphate transferase [Chloroflexi bacterium]|nr:undecaprenyl/decaprenyl-phosphate alpha-N-acetylglucosaminyl 1-phosphate transferase [Chloroflexota bacterium]
MLVQVILIFAAALILALGVTPLARRLAFRTDMVDRPDQRKTHTQPTPLLGGVAIYAAVILALILLGDRFYVHQVAGIFIGATFISFLGLWDDRVALPAKLKLLGQILPAIALILTGVQITIFALPLLNLLLTLLWVLFITNAVNFLDNMDGLSAGVAAIASAFFILLAALSGQYLVGALAAAMLGACIGFLFYNFNPASIFMGDTGSLFLGFVLAAIGIKLRFPTNIPAVTWMIPLLVMGVPILDTSLVIVSRLRRRVNPFVTPGKDHLSHRLVAMGATRREAVLTIYLLGGIFGMIAIFVTQATFYEGIAIAAALASGCLYIIFWLERHFSPQPGVPPSVSSHSPAARNSS